MPSPLSPDPALIPFFFKLTILPMASARNDSTLAQVPTAVKTSQGLPGWLPSRAHQALCRPVRAPTLCPPCPSLPSHPPSLLPTGPLQTQWPLSGSQAQCGQGLCTLWLVLCYLSWFTLSQFPQDGTQMSPYLSSRLSLIPNLNHHRHHHQDISHKNRSFQLLKKMQVL